MKLKKVRSLEDLIPRRLTKKHLKALQYLQNHSKEHKIVNSEVDEIIQGATWLNTVFNKINIDPRNYNIADRYRLMYGVMRQKGYDFKD